MAIDSPSSLEGEPMSLLLLSDRERGELEDIVSHTPLAKERCRAQALLWLADGPDVTEAAQLLKVSRQTIYNWLGRVQERADWDLRARPPDAPRPVRPLASRGAPD